MHIFTLQHSTDTNLQMSCARAMSYLMMTALLNLRVLMLVNGSKISHDIEQEIINRLSLQQQKRQPQLAIIQVGDHPASTLYVQKKQQACRRVGIQCILHTFESSIQSSDLVMHIHTLNHDQNIDGLIVQLPLPTHIDTNLVLANITPKKDIDGLHPENLGRLMHGTSYHIPCTPLAICHILATHRIPLEGAHCVLVGASRLVGRPLSILLTHKKGTVTLCHEWTHSLETHVKNADILVSAVGKPNLIPAGWINPASIVIDVGINYLPSGTVCGDIDPNYTPNSQGLLTPVPGGVGPVTVTMLLRNTVDAWQRTQLPV